MSDYDSPWREALDLYFELFLAFFFPQAHADIDWSRGYETLETELQQVIREATLGRHRADKLVKVWLRDGQEAWILIHVEVESQQEADFPQRTFTYNSRIFDLYNRTAVWRSWAMTAPAGGPTGSAMVGGAVKSAYASRWSSCWIMRPTCRRWKPISTRSPPWCSLTSRPGKHATTRTPGASGETRHDPDAWRIWKVRLIKGLYERGLSKQDVAALFRIIDWMMYLPKAVTQQFWQEMEQYEKEKQVEWHCLSQHTALTT